MNYCVEILCCPCKGFYQWARWMIYCLGFLILIVFIIWFFWRDIVYLMTNNKIISMWNIDCKPGFMPFNGACISNTSIITQPIG